jgi:hypothetical protein
MIIIPAPMKIAQGEPFAYDFTVSGQDWTGYAGTAKFKRRPKAVTKGDPWFAGEEEPILEVAVTADAAGLVQVGLTAAQAATLPALPVIGFRRQAVCEVSMSNGVDVKKYQIRVLTAAQI